MAGPLGSWSPEGSLKNTINPQLSVVGQAQMTHNPVIAGPNPNAPVSESPSTPGEPPVPGLPTGKANPVSPPRDMGQYRAAMLRRLNESGANPGQPPGRPVGGSEPAPKSDIKGVLQNLLATRNSRRVLGANTLQG